MRLAIVLSHPVQYYAPWFRWMAREAGLSLRVFYLWDAGATPQLDEQFGRVVAWDIDLLSGYEHEFVPNDARHPTTERFSGLYNPQLRTRLRQWRPDAILLFGYAYRSHLQLIVNSPAPLVFRGDSHLLAQPTPPLLKRLLLRWLYGKFAAVTYVGAANRDYFRMFGVPEEKLFFVPHCVDAARFQPTVGMQAAAAELRAELGLAGKQVVLFAGKLVASKQPRELLDAFLSVASENDAIVFVGEGAEKSHLVARAAQFPGHTVRFLPFANQSAMPSRYLLADVFTLPSRGHYETWGLAVNEAMHMGVPCLVSDRVGCQRDLVTDGETGWVFLANDPASLREKLSTVLRSDPGVRARLAVNIARRIADYTYEQATAGLLRVLRTLRP